ncbi:MAG: hypothetical protein V4691_03780 [Pseudomonadota bacterium]
MNCVFDHITTQQAATLCGTTSHVSTISVVITAPLAPVVVAESPHLPAL